MRSVIISTFVKAGEAIVASTVVLSGSSNFKPLYKTARFFTDSLRSFISAVQLLSIFLDHDSWAKLVGQ